MPANNFADESMASESVIHQCIQHKEIEVVLKVFCSHDYVIQKKT